MAAPPVATAPTAETAQVLAAAVPATYGKAAILLPTAFWLLAAAAERVVSTHTATKRPALVARGVAKWVALAAMLAAVAAPSVAVTGEAEERSTAADRAARVALVL